MSTNNLEPSVVSIELLAYCECKKCAVRADEIVFSTWQEFPVFAFEELNKASLIESILGFIDDMVRR